MVKKFHHILSNRDYYWMMGDNRQNSLDARSWGYVPFDHVVGKPVMIWFSIENGKIRWERLFTTVGGNGRTRFLFTVCFNRNCRVFWIFFF